MNDFYCEEALSGNTPVTRVFESDNVLAFHHTRPFYPVHIVVIPKHHIDSLLTVGEDLLIELLDVVRRVATTVLEEHGACRVLTNLGAYQDSKHLHWHVAFGDPLGVRSPLGVR
jgi:histidine triad (HIT) family protein